LREQTTFDEIKMMSAVYLSFSWILASSLKQFAGRHVAPLGHRDYCDSVKLLYDEKEQMPFYSLWFDPTEGETHYLPHLRQAR